MEKSQSREIAINNMLSAHRKLLEAISGLTPEEISNKVIDGSWTVKDILAHLAAWNREHTKEIERILRGESTWNKLYVLPKDDDKFNKEQVEKRRVLTLGQVKEEWENSFRNLIKKIRNLSDEQWNQQAGNEVWANGQQLQGQPVTVKSLFVWELGSRPHEFNHAKAIEERKL